MQAKKITTIEEQNEAFAIRKNVFVHEQGIAKEIEFDGLDDRCDHVLVYYDGLPVGTGRLRLVDGLGKLERVAVLSDYRACGVGRKVIEALEQIAREKELSQIKLHGQTKVEPFYHKLGYRTASDVFLEEDIPHVVMVKDFK